MTTQFLRMALSSRRQSEQTSQAAATVVREAQRETDETMKRFDAQTRAAAEAAGDQVIAPEKASISPAKS